MLEVGQVLLLDQDADRIRYLLTIPPRVKDPTWKERFEALLDDCQ